MSSERWTMNRQVNLSFLLQLLCLASLIIGSWTNIQNQLEVLQRDVSRLLQKSEQFHERVQHLNEQSIALDYRLRSVEEDR
ncbi:hypothetical protein STSP2_00247 [Anaerohalosphaera lusitana]|uniref:Uncharacterized protein n=1 Tax=Anaerohalosphaera lusitana TaxID=1936003 RepID=A0A1U9NHX0_9BACT|nr:hypothetical protein [Anaerohalosphaera lusitana]AQT67106.1 hypothetical protein STSP2_00247 [Anaerohalosphaera lusitana]